jgi:hypothetical protein
VSQVKFDVNRADKHIIQSIAILDTLDKDINTFAMRVREWCASWRGGRHGQGWFLKVDHNASPKIRGRCELLVCWHVGPALQR